jgi:cystathionine beta-lyase
MALRTSTDLLQPPAGVPAGFASLVAPVHRASTVLFRGADAFVRRRARLYDGYTYGLYGTPTTEALARTLAGMEGAARVVLAPSGLAAIALVNFAVLRAGDQVLLSDAMYGPTREAALKLLAPLGVEATFYDPLAGGRISARMKANTRLVWIESPGTITMEMQDVPAIAAAARRAGALVAMDNSWATPLRFRPLEHGVDYSVQALTKFIGGHADLLLGSVAVRRPALFRRLRDTQGLLGSAVSADDCALALRGIGTLAVRLERQNATALALAKWLASRREVGRVLHPALPSDEGHRLWKRDCRGAGAVFSLVLRDSRWCASRDFVDRLHLFRLGASWGGIHSLVSVYAAPPARQFGARGIDSPVIRLSAGLEDPADLIADLRDALGNSPRRTS